MEGRFAACLQAACGEFEKQITVQGQNISAQISKAQEAAVSAGVRVLHNLHKKLQIVSLMPLQNLHNKRSRLQIVSLVPLQE